MKTRQRAELKARFAEGSMPSMSDFDMLIDSTMNINDDGIEHSPRHGLCLTQMSGDERRLLSFYRQGVASAWAMGLDAGGRSLAFETAPPKGAERQQFADGPDGAVLALVAPGGGDDPDGDPYAATDAARTPGRVGINKRRPDYELDVGGTVASSARRGVEGPQALADGEWHTICTGLDGCVALEVVAGTGKEGTGKYALMHAFALKVFDAKGDITYHRAHYGARRHRLELREGWVRVAAGEAAQRDHRSAGGEFQVRR